jgi:dihydrolipoamide dehydrogenase
MKIKSTVEGKVGKIKVKVGDVVSINDVICIVENGKLTNPLKSSVAGKIASILVEEGQNITKDTEILEVETDGASELQIKSEFSGKVIKIFVKNGDSVAKDDIILKVEAGKLNQKITASSDFIIVELLVKEGDVISKDQVVAEVAPAKAVVKKPKEPIERGTIKCDLAILGSGPGGYQAAIYAAKQGLNVVCIEKEWLGGTCLNVGCIPTKSLIHCADVYRESTTSEDFGITNKSTSYSLKGMVAHKDRVVLALRNGVGSLFENNKVNLVNGKGSFVDANTIKVTGEENAVIKFDKCIIATGSSIAKLPIEGIDLPIVMDSDKVLSNTEDFDSITIVGGGVIGMEFASIFATLGKVVNVVEFLPEILAVVDDDMIAVVKKEIKANYFLSSGVKKIEEKNGKAVVTYDHEGKLGTLTSDKVLVAVGRSANIKGFDLEKSGVKLDERGRAIQVNDLLETNVKNIYAIGDVTGKLQLAHVASNQGFVAVDNIVGNTREMDYINVPSVIFTHPEIATVGMSEKMLQKAGKKYNVKKVPFSSNGKALSMGEIIGFVKLIEDDETNKIVGGAVIGPDAGNLIATITVQINTGLTAKQVAQTVFAHPTLAEVLNDTECGYLYGSIHEVHE